MAFYTHKYTSSFSKSVRIMHVHIHVDTTAPFFKRDNFMLQKRVKAFVLGIDFGNRG